MLSLPFALLKIAVVAVLTFCLLNIAIDEQPLFYHLRKFMFAKSVNEQMTQAVDDMKKRAGEALTKSLEIEEPPKENSQSKKESGKKKESDPIKDLIKKKSP